MERTYTATWNRIITFVLALLMLLQCLQLSAFADDSTTYSINIEEGNGGTRAVQFTVGRDATTNALTASAGTGATSATASGTTVTVGAETDAATYTFTVSVNVNDDKPHSLTATATSKKGFSVTVPNGAVNFDDNTATVYATVGQTCDITVSVNWNDNNDQSSKRLTENALLEKLTLKNGEATVTATPVFSASTYNTWTYVYKDLPAGDYTVTQDGTVEGYLTPDCTGDATNGFQIVNTLEAEFTVQKQWFDRSTYTVTRPASADYAQTYLTLSRNNGTSDLGSYDVTVSGETGDLWTFTYHGLPAFDSLGNPYAYSVTDSYQYQDGTDKAYGKYISEIRNVGAYANKTDAVYNGGTVLATIYNERLFNFKKVWIDALAAEPTKRPDITFRLFRYPEGGSMEDASPVQGMDTVTLNGTASSPDDGGEGAKDITYTVGGNITLPVYDNTGTRYLYFVRETVEGDNGYETSYDNTAATRAGENFGIEGVTTALFDGGTVKNQKTETTSVTATKVWNAKALQGIIATATLGLYYKDGESWVPYQDSDGTHCTQDVTTMIGSAESSQVTFTNLPNGREWAVFEVGVKLKNGKMKTLQLGDGASASVGAENGSYFADHSEYTIAGASFRVDNDIERYTVSNTLIGETEFLIKKNWNPDLASGVIGSITVKLYQNGTDFTSSLSTADLSEQSGVTAALENGSLILGGMTGDSKYLLIRLPKYDKTGAEYVYTVYETACTVSQEPQYALSDLTYSVTPIYTLGEVTYETVQTATFTNVTGPGVSNEIELRKEWLDDSDDWNRKTVTIEVVSYDESNGDLGTQEITLTAENNWQTTVSVPVNATSFRVRETKIGEAAVTWNESDRKGTVTTDRYIYSTWTTDESTGKSFTIHNLRQGTVDVTIEKTWDVDTLTGLTAHFALTRSVAGGTPTTVDGYEDIKVTQPTSGKTSQPYEIKGLPKYDDQGRLYTYRVTELKLTDSSPNSYDFADTSSSTTVGSVTVVSSGAFTYTANQAADPDTLVYTVKNETPNTRGDLYINKIWRDGGTKTRTVRPDIVLKLYRTTEEWETVLLNVAAYTVTDNYVNADQMWNTNHSENDFYWTFRFPNLPKYDENGNKYVYFVQETMASPADYKIAYYNSTPVTINASATSTKDTFGISKSALIPDSVARAAFDNAKNAGVIVNYLEADCSISGRKIWANLPAWYAIKDLPDVYIWLLRDGAKVENVNPVCLEDGESAYEFGRDKDGKDTLPKYDEWGNLYLYTVTETVDENDTVTEVPIYHEGYEKPVITETSVTNTYHASANVTVTVEKKWVWDKWQDDTQLDYTAVNVSLYQRYEGNGGTKQDHLVETKTINGGNGTVANASGSVTFENLPYYAPNGKPYEYFIKESAAGYSTTYSSGTSEAKTDGTVVLTTVSTPMCKR